MLLKRAIAFWIDVMLASIIVIFPIIMFDLPRAFSLIGYILVIMKDISGKSVGKRLLKIKLVDTSGQQPLGKGSLILRNVSLILWPIEGIIMFFNHGRRVGDLIGGSMVEEE